MSVSGEGMTNNGRDALRQNGDGVGGFITYDHARLRYRCWTFSSSKRTDAQNTAVLHSATATVLKPTPVVLEVPR
ncbi:hypothetical protein ACLB1T_33110 [Escherichia coli]